MSEILICMNCGESTESNYHKKICVGWQRKLDEIFRDEAERELE